MSKLTKKQISEALGANRVVELPKNLKTASGPLNWAAQAHWVLGLNTKDTNVG